MTGKWGLGEYWFWSEDLQPPGVLIPPYPILRSTLLLLTELCLQLTNSNVEALTPNVMMLGDGPLGDD